jgi:hypothetical protein
MPFKNAIDATGGVGTKMAALYALTLDDAWGQDSMSDIMGYGEA